MSRKVYTYSDITRLHENKYYRKLIKYPIITVSADMRKGLIGTLGIERYENIFDFNGKLAVSDFRNLTNVINNMWSSDQTKFSESVILSEFMRKKLSAAKEEKERNWLNGCMRNIDSLMSAINLLVEARIEPDQLNAGKDKNLALLIEAWVYLMKRDQSINTYIKKMERLTAKREWEDIFAETFEISGLGQSEAVVFLGFYYITPIQEHIMQLLEQSGYQLIYLIPYDEKFPFVHEIWDKTYSQENGYEPRSSWKMEKSFSEDPYGMIFEGEKNVTIHNKLTFKEYGSVMEFVDDVKNIKEKGFTLYAGSQKDANEMLKDYFPEEYGDRKILAYPVGQFISILNKMWDDELQTITLDNDSLIDCFSSGWLSVNGIAGKQYMQDLMHILPFFTGCTTIDHWEKRIERLRKIKQDVIQPFKSKKSFDPAVSRWQEAIENPFDNFSMYAVDDEKLEIILSLIKQLLDMARELFGRNNTIYVNEHLKKLTKILGKHEISSELYDEESKIINDIFIKLSESNSTMAECAPSDIARALDLYMSGRLDDSEIDTKRIGFVRPLYYTETETIKNRSKAHLCFCDVNNMPGGNKEYIWPLTKEKISECYEKTGNMLLRNLMFIMEATVLVNRYFMYAGLKSKDVFVSWISEMNEKLLAPSPYIQLITNASGISIIPAKSKNITFQRVAQNPYGIGKTENYDRDKQPINIIKEARMAYALCPMRYVLSYVLEKHPTYESDFQQNYALNALISAIYSLMKDQGITVEQVYKNIIDLFPTLRKSEKRQVYDYIFYDREDDGAFFSSRTECGGKFYTDERLKILYPDQMVRDAAKNRFGKLNTPDGRVGLDLNEMMIAEEGERIGNNDPIRRVCTFCPHNSYCKNAVYASDQEEFYD